ncbi:MAG: hypothetical protein E6K14_02620 [Methanobacteriota archaeon]|nr:MAG: hypothetical protein E6K14_02620 [Euryarchaeota archaeon]
MREADAFERTAILGLGRGAKRDPYRLSLFGQHLGDEEWPLVLLAVQGGTLLVTDRRILEFRAHLEVHGAWNVKEFQGYVIQREMERKSVSDVTHTVGPADASSGSRVVADTLILTTAEGRAEILVSRGPEATLSHREFLAVRDAILAPQA